MCVSLCVCVRVCECVRVSFLHKCLRALIFFFALKPGQTVRDALFKAMKLRKLNSDTCSVFRLKPQKLAIVSLLPCLAT